MFSYETFELCKKDPKAKTNSFPLQEAAQKMHFENL